MDTPGNGTNLTRAADDPYPFDAFAPTLSQCFVIVIVGYLMSKWRLLRPADVSGVGAFAAYFAMPGIICASLAVADFGDFRWELLAGVFLAKLLTFLAATLLVLLASGEVGEAGAVAVFCVQSNDLPVGNPLMSSLYRDHRPQMMKYLFFIPAMTIILFVPMGSLMINIHRRRNVEGRASGGPRPGGFFWKHFRWRDLLGQARGVVQSPVVLSTALGLSLNFAFDGKAPAVLLQPIRVAAATIPGIALALLGFSFVGREKFLIRSSVVPATVLVFVKMVLTPVLLHTVLKWLTEESPSSKLLSDFALLYGIISPATGILQSAQEFRKPVAVMSAALIITSFSCFPVSYVVARFTIAPVPKMNGFVPLLKNILFWTASSSIAFSVAALVSMVMKQRWSEFPWCYVTFFAFIQNLTSSGVLLWCLAGNETWVTYCKMLLYHCGEISGYFWTSVLALLLILAEKHDVCAKKAFSFLSLAVLSVSALLSVVLCLLIPHTSGQTVYVIGKAGSQFEYLQLITTSVILLISLSIVLGCLIRHLINQRKPTKLLDDNGHDNTVFYVQEQEVGFKNSTCDILTRLPEGKGETEIYYRAVVKTGLGDQSTVGKEWTNRLTDLITIQGLMMSVRLIANLYKITRSRASEITIPLEFLQSVLFVGQGVILFLIFGIDLRTVTVTVRKWWSKTWTTKGEIPTDCGSVTPVADTAEFCQNFYTFYFLRCFADIAKERRWKDSVYKDCFWGHQLVDWMITHRLCVDSAEAEGLCNMLQTGGVIDDVTGRRRPFCDVPRLYYFVRRKPDDDLLEDEKNANILRV